MKPGRLDPALEPAEAWRQAVAGECETALAWLAGGDKASPVRAVHQARRACKRLRALLRMAEPALGETAVEARRWVAVSARQLAPTRDATVRAATLAAVLAEYREVLAEAACAALEVTYAVEAPAELPPQARDDASATLEALTNLLDDSALRQLSRRSLLGGGRLAYRRARRSWRSVRKTRSPEAWHELRSAVQVHLNQLKGLRECTGGRFRARQRKLARLTRLLGDAHDLWMLHVSLAEASEGSLGALLRPVLAAREHACYAAAADLAAELFARRPKAFEVRLEQAWVDASLAREAVIRDADGLAADA